MKISALPVIALIGLSLSAQTPPPVSPETPELNEKIIKSTTTNIIAPTLVTDRNGDIVDGLQPAQFHLYDNGREQNIQVDVTFEPISLVVAIEASSRIDALMPQLRHL